MKCFKNALVYVAGEGVKKCSVEFDETILSIGKDSSAEEIVLPEGAIVLPGFVDQHIHGAGGSDGMDATITDYETIAKTIAAEGTTSFLITTMTQSVENITKAMEAVKEYGILWIRKKKQNKSVGKSKIKAKKTVLEISSEQDGTYVLESGEILDVSLIERKDFKGITEKKYTKYLDYDKICSCLNLRFRQAGDYLVINDQGQRKLLKEYFIHEKIPADQREELPLIAEGNHILWIIGYRISAYYKVTETTKKIIQMRLRREEHGREN